MLKYIAPAAAGLFLAGSILHYENTALGITEHKIKCERLPEGFKGFRIAHISDFHNERSKKLRESVIAALKSGKPDIIVVSGDTVDCHRPDIGIALGFLEEAVRIAPVYLVAGNHEFIIKQTAHFLGSAKDLGVHVLDNRREEIERDGDVIDIVGIDDPRGAGEGEAERGVTADEIRYAGYTRGRFRILIAHRPERFRVYARYRFDLVFSGHAHGGQIRLPVKGGMFAPHQGFFPKYSEGLHRRRNTVMCVSRGIGNSSAPFRINDRPEVIFVTLF